MIRMGVQTFVFCTAGMVKRHILCIREDILETLFSVPGAPTYIN